MLAIPFRYYSPDYYVDTNTKGRLNVLQVAKELQTEKHDSSYDNKKAKKNIEKVKRLLVCKVFYIFKRLENKMSILCFVGGVIAGSIIITIWGGKKFIKKYAELDQNIYKFQLYFLMACKWIKINQQKCSIVGWLYKHNYKNIIIYGIGDLGKLLIYELEKADVNIVCGIDKNDSKIPMITIIKPDDDIPDADIIIVTPVVYYEEIKKMLQIRTNCKIISAEQLFAETLVMCGEDDYDSK